MDLLFLEFDASLSRERENRAQPVTYAKPLTRTRGKDQLLVLGLDQEHVELMDCQFQPQAPSRIRASRLGASVRPRSAATRSSRRASIPGDLRLSCVLAEADFLEILPQQIVEAVALGRLRTCGVALSPFSS